MEVSGQFHAPVASPPWKKNITHRIGGWVEPRVSLDAVVTTENTCPAGIETWSSRPCTVVTTLTERNLTVYLEGRPKLRLFNYSVSFACVEH